MSGRLDAVTILDREYLAVRAKLLEIGATLDRLDRAEGTVEADPRRQRIRAGLEILAADKPDRAEQIQRLFSLGYDEHWRRTFGLAVNGQ
ncbi:MAG: hypothetical protein K1X74_13465 [Pirellulales bacterium]|nr:hypothetical protein [Pirellulales bacterium]